MRVAFQRKNIDFNPEQIDGQIGTVFTTRDITEIAGPVHKAGILMRGAFDVAQKSFIDEETIEAIGKLPGREVLLGRLLGMLASPIKMFLYLLNEKNKQTVETK